MSLREALSESTTFRMISEYGKGAGVVIESVIRLVYHVPRRGVLSEGSF